VSKAVTSALKYLIDRNNMPRTIKFRAWDKKNKWMLSPDSYGDFISFSGEYWEEANKTYDTPNQEIEPADDVILMQFTGLLDKNGVEIYEGDIVDGLHKMMPMAKVQELDGVFGVVLADSRHYPLRDFMSNFEVIGNIYENPDLIK